MNHSKSETKAATVQERGPWPFITLRHYSHRGRPLLWRARDHRKGFFAHRQAQTPSQLPFWQTDAYNWYMGGLFSLGALLFMTGSGLSLAPAGWSVPSITTINWIFFAGSIPFTAAGYLQLFQAANAPDFHPDPDISTCPPSRIAWIGWHPESPGWLSAFTQFIGTVAFNFNTYDAIHPLSGWIGQDITIWVPGMIGSLLFLISGYLAVMETCHGYWGWQPRELAWWIVFANFLGCIPFMAASILAFVPNGPEPEWILKIANLNLWLGALGFLIGARLMMREALTSIRERRK